MSRSGYTEDLGSEWDMIKWRGQVASATRGRRGQKLLVDLYKALDAMPVKELVKNELETEDGAVLACEIMFINDELWHTSTVDRYNYMKRWVLSQIKPENRPDTAG